MIKHTVLFHEQDQSSTRITKIIVTFHSDSKSSLGLSYRVKWLVQWIFQDSITYQDLCCLVYSQRAMAPLTCTFSDRTTPSCGISMQASSIWIISTGIPSFSRPRTRTWKITNQTQQHFYLFIFLFFCGSWCSTQRCSRWEVRSHFTVTFNFCICKLTVFFGNRYWSRGTLFAVCSKPRIEKPWYFFSSKKPFKLFMGTSIIGTHFSAVTLQRQCSQCMTWRHIPS